MLMEGLTLRHPYNIAAATKAGRAARPSVKSKVKVYGKGMPTLTDKVGGAETAA